MIFHIQSNKLFLIAVVVLLLQCSCLRSKSYCFFNAKERAFFISDESNDSITLLSLARRDTVPTVIRHIELNPPLKYYKLAGDSIINQDAIIYISTNHEAEYSLELKAEDWVKDKVFRCRHLISKP